MMVTFNPKDPNTFASASLDKTIKIWGLGSSVPYFTLEGHEKGVNCIDYYHGAEKPYLISGADDKTVKIWDYQNKACVQTLEGHSQNVSVACFHPELPIILSGSEDGMHWSSFPCQHGPRAFNVLIYLPFAYNLRLNCLFVIIGTVRIWHSNTYRLENTLNYGMERVWSLAYLKGSNDIALGYDEGAVVIKVRVVLQFIFMLICYPPFARWKADKMKFQYCTMVYEYLIDVACACPFIFCSARKRRAGHQHGQHRQNYMDTPQRDCYREHQDGNG
jgi:hypothetical protein